MVTLFNIILAVMVGAIILFIVKAVRQTKDDIDQRFKGVNPATRDELAKELIEKMGSQDVRCSRCGRQTFTMAGTTNMYKCQACNYEFAGPTHVLHERT